MTPTGSGAPRYTTRRFREQRWLLDGAVRTIGVEWDQPRVAYTLGPCGLTAVGDFNGIRERVQKYDDITREFERAARRRTGIAEDLQAQGRELAAAESYFIASLLYGSAQWSVFDHGERNLALDQAKRDCYLRYTAQADHEIRRVEVPFGETTLPGYLHLPARRGEGPLPVVIGISGMDTFKEMRHSIYGDRLLHRGFAGLAIDGPGQGEALVSGGLHVDHDSFAKVGVAAAEFLRGVPEVDPDRMLVSGASFGSYWATQAAAAIDGLAGCAVAFVCHEPTCYTMFEEASPTFKARYMYMTGISDEAAFDDWAQGLDLRETAASIRAPYLAIAGGDDELSPIEWTHDLFARLAGPRQLVIYEGERHGLFSTTSSRLGPQPQDLMADWLVARAAGSPLESHRMMVDLAGRTHVSDFG